MSGKTEVSYVSCNLPYKTLQGITIVLSFLTILCIAESSKWEYGLRKIARRHFIVKKKQNLCL